MMFYEYKLIDNGYYVNAIEGVGETWGLDNTVSDEGDMRFSHLGVAGYPEHAVQIIDTGEFYKTRCVAIFSDTEIIPAGGVEIAAENILKHLAMFYGWPEFETSLDENGLPVRYRIDDGPASR